MRILLITLVLALFATLLTAQDATTTTIGFRGGYGTSNLRTDSDLDAISDQLAAASSLSFGVFADFPITSVLSFRPGFELNRRGTSLAINADQEVFGINLPLGAEAKTRFTYLDLPLLLQATLPTTGAVSPYVFGGASLGYAVGGNIRTTARAIIEFNLMTSDIDLDAIDYQRFHVAAVGGLGLKARLSPQLNAFVEGRFEQSLTEPYDVPLVAAKTGFKNINIGAGVSFAL